MSIKELEFEILNNPSSSELDFLTHQINNEAMGQGAAYPFAILVRNKENEIVAGCNGSVIFGSIYTDQLWVAPTLRKQGLGKKLMEAVHEYGKKQGCTIATVATMSFQAPNFYKELGYKIDFSREGYNKGASCIFMSKKL
jgi:GNAT superfamily N-acetyltransferase